MSIKKFILDQKGRYFSWYLIGILGWYLLFRGVFFGKFLINPPYCYAHILCVVALLANALFHLKEYVPLKYPGEERIFEYVERNSYYLIMAITIFLLISTSRTQDFFSGKGIDFSLIVYSQACAIILCVFNIALFWMPTKEGKENSLVRLRHFKTILLTYALSLFIIGPAELIINLRGAFTIWAHLVRYFPSKYH